ncbi:MAG: nucleotide exchange factor GrpE [Bacillota bacterium]
MIDFRQELAKFNFASVDAEFAQYHNEAAPLIEALTAVLKRVGRELNQANLQIEEALSLFAEEKEAERRLAEQRKMTAVQEEEKLSLIEALLAALDRLEDIYRCAVQNECGSWSEQIKLLWDNTATDLLARGIFRIESEGSFFDARIHAAVQTVEERAKPNGTILEVLRCGYMYQSRLLRKAQVVVNKVDGGSTSNEQHRGD